MSLASMRRRLGRLEARRGVGECPGCSVLGVGVTVVWSEEATVAPAPCPLCGSRRVVRLRWGDEAQPWPRILLPDNGRDAITGAVYVLPRSASPEPPA